MSDFLRFEYKGREPITVGNFVAGSYGGAPVIEVFKMFPFEFLSYRTTPTSSTNADLIYNKLTREEQEKNFDFYVSFSEDLQINPSTEIFLPIDNTILESLLLYHSGQNNFSGDGGYFHGEYETILENKGIFKFERSESYVDAGVGIDVKTQVESCLVWMWVRAINRVVDISPLIQNLNTTKTSDVGSFNFTVIPIRDIDNLIFASGMVISEFAIKNRIDKHTIDFFEKNVQQNDVVFIRFEQFETDKEQDRIFGNVETLYRDTSNLNTKRTWDMIGLVDNLSSSFNSFGTDRTISIEGRDFSKVLIEDGSYFLPLKYIEGKDVEDKFIYSGDNEDGWFQRNFIDGNLEYFFSYEMRIIHELLGFIINRLSNLSVTPDSLFSGYGAFRSKNFQIPDGCTSDELLLKPMKGLWSIVRLYTDDSLKDKVVADDKLINPNGALLDFFNTVCQKPFVEFWGDTFLNTFDFIVRQPPFTKEAIQEVLRDKLYIEIDGLDLFSYDLSFEQEYYSHYQLTPTSNWVGNDDGLFQALIPIIYFEEYAQTFGNKRFYIEDPYLSRISVYGEGQVSELNNALNSLINDYVYLVETTAYLPFTRRGSITLNGDRRIKRGGFVLNKATDELFYVDSVSNNFLLNERSIDRTTTIQVSRGMKIHHILKGLMNIDGRPVPAKYTYFDIALTERIKEDLKKKSAVKTVSRRDPLVPTKGAELNFGIDKKAFKYFLNRKHFE